MKLIFQSIHLSFLSFFLPFMSVFLSFYLSSTFPLYGERRESGETLPGTAEKAAQAFHSLLCLWSTFKKKNEWRDRGMDRHTDRHGDLKTPQHFQEGRDMKFCMRICLLPNLLVTKHHETLTSYSLCSPFFVALAWQELRSFFFISNGFISILSLKTWIS